MFIEENDGQMLHLTLYTSQRYLVELLGTGILPEATEVCRLKNIQEENRFSELCDLEGFFG